MKKSRFSVMIALALIGVLSLYSQQRGNSPGGGGAVGRSSEKLIAQGRNIFRNDTFGDQDFWGGTLQLHRAIEGAAHGGVGPGVSPAT
ncbi:MAG TPA: hypothetical protein VLA83_10065, partial [Candidatus Binatia bacterium]|nr:hypothetical protein [Candidatus Binatia bacterium]